MTVELLRQNLAIEPDLQHFIGFSLAAVKSLEGNVFAASIAALKLARALRDAGAASGYPLPVSLALEGSRLFAKWEGKQALLANLKHPPAAAAVEELRSYLQQSTESIDPEILLRRNAEMMRYLDEARARTDKEIEKMQHNLAKHQVELKESIRMAETDPLTGLLNRRAYDEKLPQAFSRTLRQKGAVLSLVLMDLDYFKQVNDEHGHLFGDSYLNKMAHAIRSVIRNDVDLAFRFGGDEFALLLFADKNTACRKATQVLAYMGNRVSAGIASVSEDGHYDSELQHFVHRADNALYEAKRAGRGRVVVDTFHADGSISWSQHLPPPPDGLVA